MKKETGFIIPFLFDTEYDPFDMVAKGTEDIEFRGGRAYAKHDMDARERVFYEIPLMYGDPDDIPAIFAKNSVHREVLYMMCQAIVGNDQWARRLISPQNAPLYASNTVPPFDAPKRMGRKQKRRHPKPTAVEAMANLRWFETVDFLDKLCAHDHISRDTAAWWRHSTRLKALHDVICARFYAPCDLLTGEMLTSIGVWYASSHIAHACPDQANCFADLQVSVEVDSGLKIPLLRLYATRTIKAGEELTFSRVTIPVNFDPVDDMEQRLSAHAVGLGCECVRCQDMVQQLKEKPKSVGHKKKTKKKKVANTKRKGARTPEPDVDDWLSYIEGDAPPPPPSETEPKDAERAAVNVIPGPNGAYAFVPKDEQVRREEGISVMLPSQNRRVHMVMPLPDAMPLPPIPTVKQMTRAWDEARRVYQVVRKRLDKAYDSNAWRHVLQACTTIKDMFTRNDAFLARFLQHPEIVRNLCDKFLTANAQCGLAHLDSSWWAALNYRVVMSTDTDPRLQITACHQGLMVELKQLELCALACTSLERAFEAVKMRTRCAFIELRLVTKPLIDPVFATDPTWSQRGQNVIQALTWADIRAGDDTIPNLKVAYVEYYMHMRKLLLCGDDDEDDAEIQSMLLCHHKTLIGGIEAMEHNYKLHVKTMEDRVQPADQLCAYYIEMSLAVSRLMGATESRIMVSNGLGRIVYCQQPGQIKSILNEIPAHTFIRRHVFEFVEKHGLQLQHEDDINEDAAKLANAILPRFYPMPVEAAIITIQRLYRWRATSKALHQQWRKMQRAAPLIQSHVRTWLAQCRYRRQVNAIVAVQTCARRRFVTLETEELRKHRREAAALCIQRYARRHLAKLHMDRLRHAHVTAEVERVSLLLRRLPGQWTKATKTAQTKLEKRRRTLCHFSQQQVLAPNVPTPRMTWAALVIQRQFRSKLVQTPFQALRCAAIAIQRRIRGNQQRRRFLATRAIRKRTRAIIMLQSAMRGWCARRRFATETATTRQKMMTYLKQLEEQQRLAAHQAQLAHEWNMMEAQKQAYASPPQPVVYYPYPVYYCMPPQYFNYPGEQ